MAENKLIGPNDRRYGSYLPFLEFRQSFNHLEYQDYSRSLDIATAEHRVKYRSNGAHFVRTAFASYPDNMLVFVFESDKAMDEAHFYFENNEFYAENSMSDEANIFPSKEKEKN